MQINIDTKTPKRIWEKLKQQVAENPVLAIALGTAALKTGVEVQNSMTKRKNAKTERINAHAWDREVARREAQQRKS